MTVPEKRLPVGWALATIAMGLYPIALSLDLLPGQDSLNGPPWVGVLAGGVFVLAGIAMLAGPQARVTHVLAAVLLLSLAAIGGWIAVAASSAGFSGGVPFLPGWLNVSIARVMFGCGALICLGMTLLAIRYAWRGPDRR